MILVFHAFECVPGVTRFLIVFHFFPMCLAFGATSPLADDMLFAIVSTVFAG